MFIVPNLCIVLMKSLIRVNHHVKINYFVFTDLIVSVGRAAVIMMMMI